MGTLTDKTAKRILCWGFNIILLCSLRSVLAINELAQGRCYFEQAAQYIFQRYVGLFHQIPDPGRRDSLQFGRKSISEPGRRLLGDGAPGMHVDSVVLKLERSFSKVLPQSITF